MSFDKPLDEFTAAEAAALIAVVFAALYAIPRAAALLAVTFL